MVKGKQTAKRFAKRQEKRFGRPKSGSSRVSYGKDPNKSMLAGNNPTRAMVFKGTGFPDRLTTNLVYTDSFILVPSAGTILPYKTYRLNGVFDPDQSLGGGQPQYYDQLAAIYNRYCVNGAKLTAYYSRTTTTAAGIGPYIVGVSCSNTTLLPGSSGSSIMQGPNTSYDVLAQDDGTRTCTATYSRMANLPDSSQNTTSAVTTTPNSQWFANVWITPQGVDVVAPVNVMIKIEYNVTFSEVSNLADA